MDKISIDFDDGKYTVVWEENDAGSLNNFHALRYGEKWRDLNGDNLVLTMFFKILELQKKEE